VNSSINKKHLQVVSTASLGAGNNEVILTALEVKRYELLLLKIAESFGFKETESKYMVQQVYSSAIACYTCWEHSLPLKVWLSKSMVRKCIFKISSELFESIGINSRDNNLGSLKTYFNYTNTNEISLQKMPLDLRAVYLLCHTIQFTDIEVAEILNTTVQNIKQRLHKALLFMSTCHQPSC
jgi:hypothetical protein